MGVGMAQVVRRPVVADHEKCVLVVIDLQRQFLEAATGDAALVLENVRQLLLLADVLGIPVVATLESPVDRKGGLPDKLASCFPESGKTFTKSAFNLCADPAAHDHLRNLGRSQCIVVGAETDVCVMQSVLGMLKLGFEVFLLEDCAISSTPDTGVALARMYDCGAIPSTLKSMYYELVRTDEMDEKLRRDLADRGWQPPDGD